jgi:hypothetical protein
MGGEQVREDEAAFHKALAIGGFVATLPPINLLNDQ